MATIQNVQLRSSFDTPKNAARVIPKADATRPRLIKHITKIFFRGGMLTFHINVKGMNDSMRSVRTECAGFVPLAFRCNIS